MSLRGSIYRRMRCQSRKQARQLIRQRRVELPPLARAWMMEAEPFGVEELSPQRGDGSAQFRVRDRLIAPAAINLVAHDRMLEPSEMHSDLMRAPGLDLNIKQREPLEASPHAIERERGPARTHHSHARPVARVARKRLLDPPLVLAHPSVHERDVRFEDRACAKLIRELLVRLFGLGDDE